MADNNLRKAQANMKKYLSILISIILCCGLFTGCSNTDSKTNSKKINIVCTIFPQYDWVMNIIGDDTDKYNVSLLVENGTDLHSFQPGARDIVDIATCDLFIYVGGESDSWVQDVLKNSENKNRISINMTETLGDLAKEEEIIEGMEAHEHDLNEAHHEHDSGEENHEEVAYDEHVWLSLKNAKIICNEISSVLCRLDSDNADSIESNCTDYISELSSLDTKYSEVANSSDRQVLLFGDRFPFRYMVDDYGLDYYAAFEGCSAETEASFKTIVFLAEKIDELALPYVCVTESSDKSVANTIIENTKSKNQNILTFNSIQSVSKDKIENGISYLEIMKSNLSVLKNALN